MTRSTALSMMINVPDLRLRCYSYMPRGCVTMEIGFSLVSCKNGGRDHVSSDDGRKWFSAEGRGLLKINDMSSSTLQCSIKGGSDAVNIVKSAEIRSDGEGGYLSNLSSQLRQLQSDVNASLSELVDKEKSRGTTTRRSKGKHSHTSTGIDIISMVPVINKS